MFPSGRYRTRSPVRYSRAPPSGERIRRRTAPPSDPGWFSTRAPARPRRGAAPRGTPTGTGCEFAVEHVGRRVRDRPADRRRAARPCCTRLPGGVGRRLGRAVDVEQRAGRRRPARAQARPDTPRPATMKVASRGSALHGQRREHGRRQRERGDPVACAAGGSRGRAGSSASAGPRHEPGARRQRHDRSRRWRRRSCDEASWSTRLAGRTSEVRIWATDQRCTARGARSRPLWAVRSSPTCRSRRPGSGPRRPRPDSARSRRPIAPARVSRQTTRARGSGKPLVKGGLGQQDGDPGIRQHEGQPLRGVAAGPGARTPRPP